MVTMTRVLCDGWHFFREAWGLVEVETRAGWLSVLSVVLAMAGAGVSAQSGRVVCGPMQDSGAALVRGADLVIEGDVEGLRPTGRTDRAPRLPDGAVVPVREIAVRVRDPIVLRGQLGGGGSGGAAVDLHYWEVFGLALTGPETGVPIGHALIPLRQAGAGYRAVQDCWVPVVPLRWGSRAARKAAGPGGGDSILQLLLSVGPADKEWPITPRAASICQDLFGGVRTSQILRRVAMADTYAGDMACAAGCRLFGQCQCAAERIAAGRSSVVEELRHAMELAQLRDKNLERAIRFREWPAILAITGEKTKGAAIATMQLHDSPGIRRLAASLAP